MAGFEWPGLPEFNWAQNCHRVVGRTHDVFNASDYGISPIELESVLIGHHPAVVEAAVVPRRTRCGWLCRKRSS